MDNHDVEMQLSENLLLKEGTFEISRPNQKFTLNYENEAMTNDSSQINFSDRYISEIIPSDRNILFGEGHSYELYHNKNEPNTNNKNVQVNLNPLHITQPVFLNEAIYVTEIQEFEENMLDQFRIENSQKKNAFHENVLVNYAVLNKVFSPTESKKILINSKSSYLEEDPDEMEYLSIDDFLAYDSEIEEFQYQQILLKTVPIQLSKKLETYVWSCLFKRNHYENEYMLRVCFS